MSDTTNLDTREKVDILIKQYYGFPTTDENKEWYEETKVDYNNSFNGEYVLIDPIPEQPDFDTNGIVRKASDIGLNNDNFIDYSDDDDNKSSASIVDDSTGTVRRFKLLILESTPNTLSSGFAWFKEDSNGNNVLQDTFQFNFKQYKNGGVITNPYLYEVYTQRSQPLNQRLPFGKKGGNFSIDLKSGVLFFADYNNFSNGVQTDPIFQINVNNNKPVLTIYKYIGRKGIAKQLSIEESKDDITDPVKNQIVIQTNDNTIHRFDGTDETWKSVGGSGNSDISFNDTKPSSVPPDFEENQLFVDTSHNIIFRVEEDDNENKSFEQISEKILSGTDNPSGNITGYEGQFYIQKLNPGLLYYNNGTQWVQISGSGGGANGGTQIDNDQILTQTSEVVSTIEQSQSLGTDNSDITGSSKEYTFPPGAIKVIYRFSFNLTWGSNDKKGDTISEYKLQISTNDGSSWSDLKTFRLRNSVFSENFATIEHVIEKDSYPNSIKIKLVGKSINSEFKQKIHYSYLPESQVVKPILELVTLGTRTIQGAALFNKDTNHNLFYTDGNVGIGTNDPDTALVVRKNNDNSYIKVVSDSSTKEAGIQFINNSSDDDYGGDYYIDWKIYTGKQFGDNNPKNESLFFSAHRSNNQDYPIDPVMLLSYNGNVGIGTDNPSKKLHIKADSDDALLKIERTGSGSASLFLGGNAGWGNITSSTHLSLKAGDTTSNGKTYNNNLQLFLHEDGNVGIGTTDPGSRLCFETLPTDSTFTWVNGGNITGPVSGIDVNPRKSKFIENGISWKSKYSSSESNNLTEDTSENVARIFYQPVTLHSINPYSGDHQDSYRSGRLVFTCGDNEAEGKYARMVINSRGYVGIGTDDPRAKLHIAHDQTTDVTENIISLRTEGAIRTYTPNSDVHIRSEITSHTHGGKLLLYNGYKPTSNNPSDTNEIQVQLSAKDSETSYIDNGGKVGIGTTEPNSKLHVYGGVSIGGASAASDGNLIVAGTISGATITSTGTISGATITSTGTISGATITSTGNISLNGADIDSYSGNGLALQSAHNITNRNVKIPTGKLVVGSSGNANYPLEVYGGSLRGYGSVPYLDFGSVGIHVQEDNNWDDKNKLIYAIATGSSGRNIFIKNYGSRNISIWSQNSVACVGIQQVSDERIKINIRDISDNISLQKLRDISCCLYEYKDPLSRDFYTQLGFIAQQVIKHLPLAISFVKDIIPNEMRIIENPQWSKIIDGSNNKFKLTIPDLEDVSGNTKYKFYMSNDVSGNDECEKISSTLEDERKSFIFDQSWNYVYLYGKEVDDFHRINKDKLFALNFSATQEIDRIQQQQLIDISGNTLNIAKNETDIELLKLENSELKTENADLKTELATLKTQMIDVLSRLSQLESN